MNAWPRTPTGAVFCRDTANANGLMVRQTGDAMIMAPPLISSTEEIDILVAKLARALDETADAATASLAEPRARPKSDFQNPPDKEYRLVF